MSPKRTDENSKKPGERTRIRKLAWLLAAFALAVYFAYMLFLIATGKR